MNRNRLRILALGPLIAWTFCVPSCARNAVDSTSDSAGTERLVERIERDAATHPLPPHEWAERVVLGGRPATVLVFIAPDCPISNAYAPELARIAADYTPRGVVFYGVHADPRVGEEQAQRHAEEYGYPFKVVRDGEQALARRVGATVTPEAAVLDARGKLVYLGRVDDLYYGLGRRRGAGPSTRELRDALDAVLEGRAVEEPRVPAIGCEIPPPA